VIAAVARHPGPLRVPWPAGTRSPVEAGPGAAG
jgi:hypothetical protein